ncbi:enoyl-CoA hydratase/isomerase family protein [Rhizobiales bacterium TNE-4]|nr:enoyl-CoA hydratase/isomerase family protein [Rhizobiales bacterium TNE-4]MBV1827327.1 enoyl-CoA hydratase/isomerase family protein [Rhizobiales bacterium TNE-4]
MSEAPVLYAVDGAVATITMNRPAQLNALNRDLAFALRDAVKRAAEDETIRAVRIQGEGRAFMAGGDVGMFAENFDAAPETIGHLIEAFHGIVTTIRTMPKPVIAVLQGAVAGGGLGLALACDVAIAADNVVMISAYTKLGTSPDGGTTWSVTQALGARRAIEFIMLNDPLDAKGALALGFVNRVVPLADLETESMAYALRFVAGSKGANAAVKRLVHAAAEGQFASQLALERASFIERAGTADFREGVTAFIEKRPTRF